MHSQRHDRLKKDNKNSKRILLIVENNTVPQDIRVWREARTAKLAGYSVTIIAPKNVKFLKNFEIIDDIEIYRHPFINKKRGIINQLVEYANALFWEVVLSVWVFSRKRFHIIHAANPPDHIFLIAYMFKLFGVKFVFDHHDLAPELYISKFNGKKNIIYGLLCLMEKLSCLTADAVVSTNQSYKKQVLSRHGIKPEKVFVVRNDPEVPKTQEKERTVQYRDKHLIKLLYVGSINNQDGVDVLITVVHILVNKLNQRHINCMVIGDGDDLPSVKRLCTELEMDPYFDFTGYIYDRKIIQKSIYESDICLETAPYSEANSKSTFIKVMEYMSAGKPIVAFDMDETRYSSQDSALLIEHGDLMGFAEAIEMLICQPSLREKLGEYGKRRITEVLNWDNSSRELLKAYEYISKS
jgi:glycosyltransferase involved in cell wall biosynthesis